MMSPPPRPAPAPPPSLSLEDLAKFQLVVENTSNMVVVTNQAKEIEWVNRAYTKVTGWTLDEVRGRRPGSYLQGPGTDIHTVRRIREALARGEPVTGVELLNYTKDGREFWVSLNIQPVRDESGEIRHFVAIESDVTDRKRYEQALLEQRRLLQQALDLACMGSWEMDHVSRAVVWSDEVYRLFGVSRGSFACRYEGFLDLVHPEDRATVMEAFEHSLRERAVYQVEHRVVLPSGETRWLLERGTTQFDARGQPLKTSGFTQDITESKRTEQLERDKQRLEQLSRAKTEFLSCMSHELRTPLNAIVGLSQLLQARGGHSLPPEVARYPAMILQASEHLLQLINDLLDLSLIESGGLALVREPVDLGALVQDVVQMMQPIARHHEVAMLMGGGAGPCPKAWGDPTRVRQCLINLVSNGIKYNRRGGTLRLVLHTLGEEVCVDVIDEGEGLAPEQLERLFLPFSRLGRAPAAVEGTGLGLALTRSLAERMGGSVSVPHSQPGQGSIFRLALAAVPPAGIRQDPPEAHRTVVREDETSCARVLCVEDNEVNRVVFEGLFALRPGLRVDYAMTGRDALALARARQPQLVVLDMHLPDMSGAEVFEALQADPATRGIPVLACSASAYAEDIEAARIQGLAGYMTKPVDMVEFLSTLDRHLPRLDAA